MRVQIWISKPSPQLLLEIDATPREGHSFTQEITEHPVEDGADVADHVRPKPDVLTLECVHSNTPIVRAEDLTEAIAGAGLQGARTQTAYQAIRSLGGRVCDVVTELRKYESVALASCEVSVTAANGDALGFSASFRQVNQVQTSTVRVRAKVIHANPPANLGQQPTTPADAATKDRSALVELRDAGKTAWRALRGAK